MTFLRTNTLIALLLVTTKAFAPSTLPTHTALSKPKPPQPSASTLVDYDVTLAEATQEQALSCPFSALADPSATAARCPITKAKEVISEGLDKVKSFGQMMHWSAQELMAPQTNKEVPFLPEGTTPFGFAGDLQFAGADQVAFLASKFKDHPDAKGYVSTLGGVPFMALSDMSSIKQVLRERPSVFERVVSSAVPDKVGMTFAAGDTWHAQRKLLAPVFREREVQKATVRIAEIAKQVVDEVERQSSEQHQAVDFKQMSSIMAMSVAAKSAGLNVNLAKDNLKNYHAIPFFSQVIEAFRGKSGDFINDPAQALLTVECPSLALAEKLFPKNGKAINAMKEMYQFPQEYLEALQGEDRDEAFAELCKSRGWDMTAEPSGLINNLLKMDDGHLMASALAVVGFFSLDSTTSQIMWILYEITKNPETYQQLRAEVLSKEAVYSHEKFDISQYPFMEACIAEAERMHPVFEGIIDASMAVKEFEMHGRKMPKGTVVVGMKKLAMENAMKEDGFTNLDFFDPFRFLKYQGGDIRMDRGLWKKYNLGFGGGPRECPGQHLFKYETMMLLRELALRFDSLDFDEATCGVDGESIGETLQGALRPTHLNLRLHHASESRPVAEQYKTPKIKASVADGELTLC